MSPHSIDLSHSGFLLKTGSNPRDGTHSILRMCTYSCGFHITICLIWYLLHFPFWRILVWFRIHIMGYCMTAYCFPLLLCLFFVLLTRICCICCIFMLSACLHDGVNVHSDQNLIHIISLSVNPLSHLLARENKNFIRVWDTGMWHCSILLPVLHLTPQMERFPRGGSR